MVLCRTVRVFARTSSWCLLDDAAEEQSLARRVQRTPVEAPVDVLSKEL